MFLRPRFDRRALLSCAGGALVMAAAALGAIDAQPRTQPSTQPRRAPSGGGPPAGIWWSLPVSPRAAASGSPEYEYLTLYPDGRALWDAPAEGLAGTPPTADRGYWRQWWSRYELVGNELRFTMLETPTLHYTGVWTGDRLVFSESYAHSSGDVYRFLPPLTGPIEGLYRPAPDWKGIRFALDGTFVDEGFRAHLGSYASADGALHQSESGSPAEAAARRGGRGRYTIRDYTLELRYDDGRVVRHTILTAPAHWSARPLPAFTVNGQLYRRQ